MWIEHARAGRRELHAPERVTGDVIPIQPPAEIAVEALGAIDIRDGNDDHLEFHVHRHLGSLRLRRHVLAR